MQVQSHVKEDNPRLLVLTIDGKDFQVVSLAFFKEALKGLPLELPNHTEIDEWFFSLEKKIAKRYAFTLLSQKSYPKSELRKKLSDNKFSFSTIDELMEEFATWGYLDDEEWISHFVTKEIQKGYGPLLVRMKLKEKGIEEEKIDDYLNELYSEKKERKAIIELLEKRYSSFTGSSYHEKQLLMSKLQRRGFSPSIILQVVEKISLSSSD